MSDSSDDDRPLARSNGHAANGVAKRKARAVLEHRPSYKDESDSDDNAPLAKRKKPNYAASDSEDEPIAKARARKPPPPPASRDTPMRDSDDSDVPLSAKVARPTKRQSNGAATVPKKTNGVQPKDESDSDAPILKKKTAAKPARPATKPAAKAAAKPAARKPAAAATPKKGAKAAKKEEAAEGGDEDEDEYRWWDQPKKEDDSIKWTTLEHNGVVFPAPYQPLPRHVRLYYGGEVVELHPEAEEVATFFGSMLHLTVNTENPTFQKNFFVDFQEVVEKTGGAKRPDGSKVDLREFGKLDFKPMFEHFKGLTEAKKNRTKDEKKAEKDEKAQLEAPYLFCKWDGRKEKVGNFRVEPPGLFRGRGEHPKTGRVKKRVAPEQVTINIGKDAPVPQAPAGHKWKAVQHDNKATWLAMWQENINGCYKYVMLAANSAVKGQADHKKFEKARELKKHITRIRADYTRELKSEVMADRQRATAMYLIDRFALRAGNEKDTDNEADTVGCCSLKYEHITLREPSTVIFDFLGKDSIPYYDEVTVDRQVFKNLKMFKKAPKEDGDDIFDRLNTSQLNKHLSSYMQGLTAKVFRTYNASYTMSQLLQELPVTSLSMAEKVKLYNDCNRKVAILCNHKRTVGASHEAQMEKMGDRIKGLKYQRWRTRMMMLDVDPKLRKKMGADYFARDADLTDEWVQAHQAFLVEELRGKVTKKFDKDNEKRAAEGEKPLPDKERKERLAVLGALEAKFQRENRTGKVEAEGKAPSVEKLEAASGKIDERIHNMELQAADKDGNKEVALSTSKINYIDPRLTVVFSKKFDVPIEKFFSKTLREKFNWAIQSVGDDATWEF